jgi:outer membrane protein OmpA-like peptidoglycan-associated protein
MSRPLSSGAAAAVAAAALLAASPARAQTPTFALDRLPMAGAPGDGIAVWRPDMSDTTRFYGQLGLGVTADPLRTVNYVHDEALANKITSNIVPMQLVTYLDVGVEILSRVALQVSFPFIAYQATNAPNIPLNGPAGTVSFDLKHVAAGDLRIEARGIVFRSESRTFKLGLSAAAIVPTGNKFSFGGDQSVGGAFGFAAEYDAKLVALTLDAAFRLRPTVTVNELVVSSEVDYALGAYVPLRRGTIRLGLELFGGVGVNPSAQVVNSVAPAAPKHSNAGNLDTAPLEWLLNGKMFFTPKRQVYAGLGFGSRLDGAYAPDFRAVALVGGSIGITDTDPKSPAARYVFEVSDPVDTDHDGIPDEVDACPLEPGEMDPDPEKIGCPKYIRRVKGSNEIQVLKRIEFEFDKSTILPVSYPILDEVYALVAANPSIRLLSIEGHTDNQGTPEYNQRLSDDRANAVLKYLQKKGLDPSRMTATGYGLTKPIATNDTDEGRQKNRRVEFHVFETLGNGPMGAVPVPAPAPTPAPAPAPAPAPTPAPSSTPPVLPKR